MNKKLLSVLVLMNMSGTSVSDNNFFSAAYAQDKTDANENADIERIDVVSSRKRDEWILDVPLAVQSFSAEDIEKAGIGNLEDLTLFAPGLDFKDQGGNFAGRLLPAIRFRGLTSESSLPSNQVGSLFVDGVYVLGGAQSIGFEDIERVEVIRGPQSAHFGRSTFGGAINYITKDPSGEFGGKFNAAYSPNFGSSNISFSVHGSIIEDVLAASLTGSGFKNGSAYTANDGGTLGEQTTNAAHLSLLYTPTEDLKVKFRASYVEDEDTAPAATAIQFSEFSNCEAGTPVTVLNGDGVATETTLGGNLWCGALPEISDGVVVSRNTTFPIFEDGGAFLPEVDVRDLMVGNSRGVQDIEDAPYLDHFGLRRQMTRLAASFEYVINDEFDLDGNISYNDQDLMGIRDGDNSDGESVYVGTPSFFEDFSSEIRLSYDAGGKIRALLGVNYYKQEIHAAFSNGVEATNSILFDTAATPFEVRIVGAQNSTPNDDEIKTLGIFGSLDYYFTENLGLTLEGRWQNDEVTRFGGTFGEPIATGKLESKEFLPRAILKWNPTDTMMTYASYSKGTLPGQFNSSFVALDPEDKAIVQAENPGLQDEVPPEYLDSYEIGVKQALMDGKLSYSTALYSMTWENMKSSISFLPPGATGFQSGFVSGESKIKGVEFEGGYVVSNNLDISLTANYTDAKYEDYSLTGLTPLFNLTTADGFKVDGNTLPRFPKWSGSLSGTYTNTLELATDWDWYTRVDILYNGKTYTDSYNLTWVDAYQKVNLKVGFTRDDLSIELYADNLLDEDGWVTGAGLAFFGEVPVKISTLNTLRAVHVSAMQPRELGVRLSLAF
ncbi:TonB-dependent receptor [Aliiglaciecola sp. 3_MG-2023]|uniref:TonB-dependent receptor n=1 Tax=Aliiglaciecola sp. 3_MG-2023 TaxID=3062644 RepID=UPI0026E1842B|nr:TonB-dependent receptor [Aliiglaciecola sp. 3_MG-2023]MDO6692003.1 TonB-dependent receptor [Aliiglaciecola sp. 3_MG-2023]